MAMLERGGILKQLERCFEDGEIETLIVAAPSSRAQSAEVVLRHVPTGREIRSFTGATQIENKARALLELVRLLLDDGHAGARSRSQTAPPGT
jgi:hypothetical protein